MLGGKRRVERDPGACRRRAGRARHRARSAGRGRRAASGRPRSRCASLRLSMKSRCGPSADSTAKASASGMCGTSLPRMLKAQATDDVSVSTAWAAPSLASAAASRASLSLASSPAYSIGWIAILASGGAGRSVQIWSIGLRSTGTSVGADLFGRRCAAPWRRRSCAATDRSRCARPCPDSCRSRRRRRLDQALDGEDRQVDLAAHLQRDSGRRRRYAPARAGSARRRPNRQSRSASAAAPSAARHTRPDGVGARHEEAVEVVAVKPFAQPCDALATDRRIAFGIKGLEHLAASRMAFWNARNGSGGAVVLQWLEGVGDRNATLATKRLCDPPRSFQHPHPTSLAGHLPLKAEGGRAFGSANRTFDNWRRGRDGCGVLAERPRCRQGWIFQLGQLTASDEASPSPRGAASSHGESAGRHRRRRRRRAAGRGCRTG